jgi:hypothetical protein
MAPVKTTGLKHENDEKKMIFFIRKVAFTFTIYVLSKLFKIKKRGTFNFICSRGS